MEPVQPSPLPDIQGNPTTPRQPDSQTSSGGRLSGLKGRIGEYFAGGTPDASSVPTTPSFEPTSAPGIRPAGNPSLETGAPAVSPWANQDAIPSTTPTAPISEAPAPPPTSAAEPLSPVVPESKPTVTTEPVTAATTDATTAIEPEPAVEPAVDTTTFQTEPAAASVPEPAVAPASEPSATPTSLDSLATPAAAPTPEPTLEPVANAEPAVSPVWTPNASSAHTDTAIEPDMRPSSAPSVEPVTPAAKPEDVGVATTETAEEPPLFRKVADGDLIRYEFTPEGRDKIKGAFTKAIEEGTFDNILGPLMDRPEFSKLDTSTPATTDTQGSHEPIPLTSTPIDTSPNSTAIPTTPATPPDWSNPGGSGPVSS